MAEVYRYNENTVMCYTHGVLYYGFENGSEKEIIKEPVLIYDQLLNPGDKLTGFNSGKDRSSFCLDYGYMTYVGKMGVDLLFEIYDPKETAAQGNLFFEKPKWLLSFTYVGNHAGLLMFSQPGACYDIQPIKIERYTN